MVQPSDFIDDVRINWRRLASVIVGAGVLAYFEALVDQLLSLADLPIALLSGLVEFNSDLLGLMLGFPATLVNQAFAGAVPYVTNAGIGGYLVAIGIVLLTTIALAWVVSNVR